MAWVGSARKLFLAKYDRNQTERSSSARTPPPTLKTRSRSLGGENQKARAGNRDTEITPLRFVMPDDAARRVGSVQPLSLSTPFQPWFSLSLSLCSSTRKPPTPEAANAYSCQCLHKYAFRLMRLWQRRESTVYGRTQSRCVDANEHARQHTA